MDLGLSWSWISHSPRLVPQGGTTLTPDYSRITQTGLDIQYLRGDTALKGEAITRRGQYDRLGNIRAVRLDRRAGA